MSDYRLARPLAARLVGLGLVALALLVFLAALVVGWLGLSPGILVGAAGVGVIAVTAAGLWVSRGLSVVHLDDAGYRIRMVRGAGVTRARWVDVEDAATTYAGEEPVVVLRLRDGRRTRIPVRALATDREEFVRELQRYLQGGHGLRRL